MGFLRVLRFPPTGKVDGVGKDIYRDFVGISLDSVIIEGCCRWNLASGNLYTFIRPNQEAAKNASLGRWQESNRRPCDSGAAL